MEEFTERSDIDTVAFKSFLNITTVTRWDSGTYVANLENIQGSKALSFNVKVNIAYSSIIEDSNEEILF